MGEDSHSEEMLRQFKLTTIKATQEAYLKYKESENTKLLQVSHITVLVIVALLAMAKGNSIAGIFLVLAMISVFGFYICFYTSDFHNANVNVYAQIQSYAETYGFSNTEQPELIHENKQFLDFRNRYRWMIIFSFAFIVLAIISIYNIFPIEIIINCNKP